MPAVRQPVIDVLTALRDPARMEILARTRLLDSVAEEPFDRATRLATRLLGVPVGLVSLVTPRRQFFKAQIGLGEPWASKRETGLSHSFCQHVVARAAPLVVNDARLDHLVKDNLAVRDLDVIAYLGVPLREPGGRVLGAFCAIDTEPRRWSTDDVVVLQDIAEMLASEVELKLKIADYEEVDQALREKVVELDDMLDELRHRMGNLFANIISLMSLTRREGGDTETVLATVAGRLAALARAHTVGVGEPDHTSFDLLILAAAIVDPWGDNDEISIEGPSLLLPYRYAAPCGLMLHELARLAKTETESTRMTVGWTVDSAHVTLTWSQDTGLGPLRTDPKSDHDMRLLKLMTGQVGGSLRHIASPDGAEFELCFPLPNQAEVDPDGGD